MGTLVLAGRYEIVEKIGDGGMAVVYKARDKQLNRFVAIKILKKEFISDQIFVENFIKEAKAAASLLHPNIVTIHDAGKDRDIYYIVMEYVEGRALSELIATEAPLDYKRCIRIAKQVASALSLAHRNNIIHRDVKPHNILITNDGTAKITDFGIAKAVSDGTIINDSGIIMGSVHYFSPEQSRGQYVDEKSDIYSLGIVLYEMITGRVPFDADNPVTIAVMHMNDTIIPPSRLVKGVPPGLDQIVMKATAKYQSDRFTDIEEMYKALDNINFITGIIDDPVIAGFVKPTNMVEEDPGRGYSAATEPEETFDDEPYDDYNDPGEEEFYTPPAKKSFDDDFDPYDDDYDEEDDRGKRRVALAAGGAGAAAMKDDFDDDEYDERERKKASKGGKLFGNLTTTQKVILIVAAVAIAVAVSIPLSRVLMGLFAPGEPVEVPDVVGLYVEEATDILKEAGFSVDIEIVPLPPIPKVNAPAATEDMTEMTEESLFEPEPVNNYESEFREGQVMEQDPAGGEMAKEGSTVKLKVAGAPEDWEDEDPDALGEPTEVPDLIGKTKANAEYAIKTAGFNIGLVGYENSDDPIDTVISQSPNPGEMAPGNSRINITISLGPKEELVAVPNLVAMTEAQAQQALQALGLNYARGNEVDAKNVNDIGKIVTQRPSANSNIKQGDTVTADIAVGFTVTFVDWNDAVLKTEAVIRGGNATAPPTPSRAGWTFTGWNGSFTNVQGNVAIRANYTENAPPPPPPPQKYTLTVNNGTGGGSYAAGTVIPINYTTLPAPDSADPSDGTTNYTWGFKNWSSNNGGTFANANANTNFTMPANNVALTPIFGWIENP